MKKTDHFATQFYQLITIAFIFCLLLSNIAEIKIINLGNIAQVGAGTLFFPLLYVFNDILTEVYGFSATRRTIWLALFVNILFSALMCLVMYLPEGKDWQEKQAFETVFALSPRIMIGSLISYFIAEIINAAIMINLKLKLQGKLFAFRAIFSTAIASFVEGVIFCLISFYGRIPNEELIKMSLTLTLLKVIYEVIIMPFTCFFVRYLKTVEGIDSYEKPSLKKIFYM